MPQEETMSTCAPRNHSFPIARDPGFNSMNWMSVLKMYVWMKTTLLKTAPSTEMNGLNKIGQCYAIIN